MNIVLSSTVLASAFAPAFSFSYLNSLGGGNPGTGSKDYNPFDNWTEGDAAPAAAAPALLLLPRPAMEFLTSMLSTALLLPARRITTRSTTGLKAMPHQPLLHLPPLLQPPLPPSPTYPDSLQLMMLPPPPPDISNPCTPEDKSADLV